MNDIDREGSFYFADTSFNSLMQKRIHKVLVVCSHYDFFMLEEDGRIDEQIFNEYVSLSLRYPPVFQHAPAGKEALQILSGRQVDLVILMLGIDDTGTIDLASDIKNTHPNLPVVILTSFTRDVSLRLEREDLSKIDHIFCWMGNANLLLAIIKLIEDSWNAPYDITEAGVQAILVVEDSIRFISMYLPMLYKIILHQSAEIAGEALNEHQKMLRRRGRPKILLARNMEEAEEMYSLFRENILGIISDVSFKLRARQEEPKFAAGIEFCKRVKTDFPNMPFVLQSSDASHAHNALLLGVGFIQKQSPSILADLSDYIVNNFGFGGFVFRDPVTLEPRYEARDLKTLQGLIYQIPDDIFVYHTSLDDISKWLNARALFPIAAIFKQVKLTDFGTVADARNYIYRAISRYRAEKSKGVIARFGIGLLDEYLSFSRVGEGSLGGKARGLAFLNAMVSRGEIQENYQGTPIKVPWSVVVCTDLFEQFMELNELYPLALCDIGDEELLQRFMEGSLPVELADALQSIASRAQMPLAVRSSSKLEDSFYQSFAGVYHTYMVPPSSNPETFVHMLTMAVKGVYASAFFRNSKLYMAATANPAGEEKMAVIIQEVCGHYHKKWFYPILSGVARSLNFYPYQPETSMDGVAHIALGLGKTVMEGAGSVRFSPMYPKKAMHLVSAATASEAGQRQVYAVQLDPDSFSILAENHYGLASLSLGQVLDDPLVRYALSYIDSENDTLSDMAGPAARPVVTFSNLLVNDAFPLAGMIRYLLEKLGSALNRPVEIEFAIDLADHPEQKPTLYLLQVRPMVLPGQTEKCSIDHVNRDEAIVYSTNALGLGRIRQVSTIVYIRKQHFSSPESTQIARELDSLNRELVAHDEGYLLIGPGRWGSADPWLGIPVKWPQVSHARVIVELQRKGQKAGLSQGTHFFHNLAAFGVAYFSIGLDEEGSFANQDFLDAHPASFETRFVRLIRFDKPLHIAVDGLTRKGVVYKP